MPLMTAPVGIVVRTPLPRHKRERVPIIDDKGRFSGLTTVKEFVKPEQFPNASKDAHGHLLVGAAGRLIRSRLDPLAGGHLALRAGRFDGFRRAGVDRSVFPTVQLGELACGGVQVGLSLRCRSVDP